MNTELASAFPHPPSYYKKFTDSNWFSVKDSSESGENAVRELKHLLPPAIPPNVEEDGIVLFGNFYPTTYKPPILPEEIPRFYHSYDHPGASRKQALKHLLRVLLHTWFQLLHSMNLDTTALTESTADTKPPKKTISHSADLVKQLRLIFMNIHHLLNEMRGFEAKEGLIRILKSQIQTKCSVLSTMSKSGDGNIDVVVENNTENR